MFSWFLDQQACIVGNIDDGLLGLRSVRELETGFSIVILLKSSRRGVCVSVLRTR